MTRGDSAHIRVGMRFKGSKERYTPVEGDTIRFAMSTKDKDNCCCDDDEEPETVLTKQIPIETLILTLEPADTKTLPFGEYSYDIEITFANGEVDTFIADATFELGKESDLNA